ncbi:MAG: TonB-dependent receptor [Comamonas sp.]
MAIAVMASSVQAQTAQQTDAPSSTEAELEVQRVVASAAPSIRSELAQTTQIIENDQLQQQVMAGKSVAEALGQLVPGIDLGGQSRSNFGQNLRGRTMLVMVDGVSLNSSRGTARQLDAIDPFNIDRIEVLSGASALYGGGATGGIVNIITKKGSTAGLQMGSEVGVTSGFQGSRDHQYRLAQSVAGGNERVQARLGIALQNNGSFYDGKGNPVRTDIAQTDAQNTKGVDVLGNMQIQISPEQSLGLTAQYYRNKFDGSSYLYGGPNLAGIMGGKPELLEQRGGFVSDVMPKTERAMINADYHASQVWGGQDLYVQGFWRQEKLDFAPFPSSVVTASRQNTDTWGLKAALAKSWGGFNLRYGVDWDRESFDGSAAVFDTAQSLASGGLINRQIGSTGRYPGYRVDTAAAFAQAEWKLGPQWSLNGGLRYQSTDLQVDDFVGYTQQVYMLLGRGKTADVIPGGKNSYNVSLFNLGARYQIDAARSTWLNYAEGFELPDPAKYYGQGSYQANGSHWQLTNGIDPKSSPLQGIKTRQVEWGFKQGSGALKLQSALFYAWSDQTLQLNNANNNVTINVLDEKRRNYGWEGSLDYALDKDWAVGGNALWIRSQTRQNGSWAKQTIMTASPSKLSTYVQWSPNPWSLRLQATHLFTLKDASAGKIDGFTVLDLMGGVKLPVGRVNFGVQNLLDKQYLTTWSQRAMALYGVGAVSPQTFAFYGRGRTFSINYSVEY